MPRTRTLAAGMCVLALLALAAHPALSQETEPPARQAVQPAVASLPKPVLLVELAPLTELRADADYLGKLLGKQNFAEETGKLIGQLTGVTSLEGLDPERPILTTVVSQGTLIGQVTMLPATDHPRLAASLEPLLGPGAARRDGLLQFGQGDGQQVLHVEGDWAYVAQNKAALTMRMSPERAQPQTSAHYDLAAVFYPPNLPPVLRGFTLARLLNKSYELKLQEYETGTAAAAIDRIRAELGYDIADASLTKADLWLLGLAIDRPQKAARLNFRLQPSPETQLAGFVAELGDAPTDFGGPWLEQEGPLSLNLAGTLRREDSRTLKREAWPKLRVVLEKGVETALRDVQAPQQEALRELTQIWWEAIDGFVSDERLNLALQARGETPPFTLVVGARLEHADRVGQRLEAWTAKYAGSQQAIEKAELNVVKLPTATVHSYRLVAEARPKPLKLLFGDELSIHVAYDSEHVWLAIGPESLAALQELIPAESAQVRALQATVRATELLRAVERANPDPLMLPVFAILKANMIAADDRIQLAAAGGETLEIQVTFHEAVLKAAALAASLGGRFYVRGNTPAIAPRSPLQRPSPPTSGRPQQQRVR